MALFGAHSNTDGSFIPSDIPVNLGTPLCPGGRGNLPFALVENLLGQKFFPSFYCGRMLALHGGHHDHLVFQVAARCFQQFETPLVIVQDGVERGQSRLHSRIALPLAATGVALISKFQLPWT